MEECGGERPTHEKNKDLFFFHPHSPCILEAEQCSCSLLLSQLAQLQAVGHAEEGKKKSLLRYLDSIVDCNKKTCSQKVYAKIFIES